MSTITANSTVADLAVGATVKLRENGGLAGYLILAKGTHGTGSTDALAIRVSLLPPCYYMGAPQEYESSTVDRWLSHGYISTLSAAARAALVPATLPCWSEFRKAAYTITRTVFLLSATEMGYTDSTRIAVEGTAVPYFASDALRVANYFGDAMPYGTRSPMLSAIGNSVHLISVGSAGEQLSHPSRLYQLFVRPAVILSGAAAVNSNNEIV